MHPLLPVPQAIAEQYLPRIDNPGGMELVVEDAVGDKYTLRFRYNPTASHDTWLSQPRIASVVLPSAVFDAATTTHNSRSAALVEADQPSSMLAAGLISKWHCCRCSQSVVVGDRPLRRPVVKRSITSLQVLDQQSE